MVLPLLLIVMFGTLELGNFFMNEHTLVKAVRNGARFAARQSFTQYPDCSSVSTALRDNTRNVVMNGYLSGGTIITPSIQAADVTISTTCAATAGGQNMTGIYTGRTNGAQVVTVSANVDYRPLIGAIGFDAFNAELNAESEAAVMGL